MVVGNHLFSFFDKKFREGVTRYELHPPSLRTVYFPTAPYLDAYITKSRMWKGNELVRNTVDHVFEVERRAFERLSEEEKKGVLYYGLKHVNVLAEGLGLICSVSCLAGNKKISLLEKNTMFLEKMILILVHGL